MHKLIFRVLRFPTAVGKVLEHLCCVFICKLERQSNDLHFLQLCYSLSPYKGRSPWEIMQVLADWGKEKKKKKTPNQKSVLWLTTCWHVCQPNKGITSLYWCGKLPHSRKQGH